MTRRTRRNHSPAFRAKGALAALKGEATLAELALRFDVYAVPISKWKDQLLSNAQRCSEARRTLQSPPCTFRRCTPRSAD